MVRKIPPPDDEGYIVVFRPWRTLPDGRRIRRKNGRPWPIRIKVR